MCTTPLPVQSELLFIRWSASFCSSLRFLSVNCAGGGVIISGLGNSGTFTCNRSSQHADVLDQGVNALHLVHVGRPEHRGLGHSRVCHSVHEVGDVLDPTSLVLIASPVLCSPTIKGSTVVAVRVVVRLGSVLSFTAAVRNSAPLPWLGGLHPCCSHFVSDVCVTCACAWSWLSHPRPPDLSQHGVPWV